MTQSISVIDSHTGGEPTRVVIDGGPELGNGPLLERRSRFADEFDHLRDAIVNEPRGSDVLVGALLCEPSEPDCAAGVIFFNNVGFLGMCGHGTIGLAVTLHHMGRIGLGTHRIDTPVGPVSVTLHSPNEVEIENVPSYRHRHAVQLEIPEIGTVIGDVAWGGNWFFICPCTDIPLDLDHVDALLARSCRIREAITAAGITGKDGAEIDHIELFTHNPVGDTTNFVLCPGLAYDRSPCGTGTSAKVACLAEDGLLEPDQWWSQRSVCGSTFRARYRRAGEMIIPTVRGSAYITAESRLLLDPNDPFVFGLRSHGGNAQRGDA